eukprot:3711468-Rhodomonas_salina.1
MSTGVQAESHAVPAGGETVCSQLEMTWRLSMKRRAPSGWTGIGVIAYELHRDNAPCVEREGAGGGRERRGERDRQRQ